MKTLTNKQKFFKFSYLLLVLALTSCGTSKRLKYFQDLPQVSTGTEFPSIAFEEVKIRPDDILNVQVNTVDLEASRAINEGNIPASGSGVALMNANNVANRLVTGYLVDHEGFLEIPILGKVKVEGKTLTEAKEAIRKQTEEYFRDATVNIRFSNFRVSIIGDVARPGTYVVPNQEVSIIDAISFSGDLSTYGRRQNIMLIRKDSKGNSVAVKMDITKKEIFNSPYFYLKQNDIVYVEPSAARILNADTAVIRYLGLLASLVSVGILVFRP